MGVSGRLQNGLLALGGGVLLLVAVSPDIQATTGDPKHIVLGGFDQRQPSVWAQYGWYIIGAAGIILAEVLTIVALVAQRTRRRRAEADLFETRRLMEQTTQRALSRRLIETLEEERRRIAAGLHDGLGQNLLVIKNRALLGLQEAARAPKAAEGYSEISRVASASLAEVREISHNLRPYQLDRFGLTRTLQTMVANVATASGVHCVAQVDSIDGLLGASMEIHCYRIVQELLNNVVKHSHASEALVSASFQGGNIRLVVADDGCGFDPVAARDRGAGMGLTDIADRVLILDGTFDCDSQCAKGTRWTIEIPMKRKEPVSKQEIGGKTHRT